MQALDVKNMIDCNLGFAEPSDINALSDNLHWQETIEVDTPENLRLVRGKREPAALNQLMLKRCKRQYERTAS